MVSATGVIVAYLRGVMPQGLSINISAFVWNVTKIFNKISLRLMIFNAIDSVADSQPGTAFPSAQPFE